MNQVQEALTTAVALDKEIKLFTEKYAGESTLQLLRDHQRYNGKIASVVYGELVERKRVRDSWIPFERQLLVTPGNGSIATIEAVCYQLVTNPGMLYVVPSSRDELGLQFLEQLQDHEWPITVFEPGLQPEFPVNDDETPQDIEYIQKRIWAKKTEPDYAVIYGSDKTCGLYRDGLPGYTRVVTYGSKTSIGIHDTGSTYDLMKHIDSYARDFFSHGGVGCLNTSVLYVLSDNVDKQYDVLKNWIAGLAYARKQFISRPSLRAVNTLSARFCKSEGDFWQNSGVFVRKTSSNPDLVGIGGGTAVVVSCTEQDIYDEWATRKRELSSATLHREHNSQLIGEPSSELYRLGVSRFTLPGQAQQPGINWRHDGYPLIPYWGKEYSFDAQ